MSFFDPSQVDADEFEQLPNGTYKVIIDSTVYKATKAGTGHYMAVTFSVQGAEFQGRKIFENYNIQNASEQAQKIGQAQFKRLCTAIGIVQALKSPDEFSAKAVNKLLFLEVVQYEDDRGQRRLKVLKYVNKQDASPTGAAKPKAKAPPAATEEDMDSIPF